MCPAKGEPIYQWSCMHAVAPKNLPYPSFNFDWLMFHIYHASRCIISLHRSGIDGPLCLVLLTGYFIFSFWQNLADIVASHSSRLFYPCAASCRLGFVCCYLFRVLFVCVRHILCRLGFVHCSFIHGCIHRCFRRVVSFLLLFRVICLDTCYVVYFVRVRLSRITVLLVLSICLFDCLKIIVNFYRYSYRSI